MLGAIQLFTENVGISELYPNADISRESGLRRQETLLKNHLSKWFKEEGLKPHLAEDDVKVLLGLATEKSEILGESVLDFIAKKLGVDNEDFFNINPQKFIVENQSVLKAKKRINFYGGRNFLNFASNSNGDIFTSGNYVKENGGKFEKRNYNTGYGLNENALYDLQEINQISLNDELKDILGDLSPEYSNEKLYHVKLKMITPDGNESRMSDLTQHLIFRSEKEMIASMSSVFDHVADRTEDGFKILPNKRNTFDIREIDKIKGDIVLKDVHNNHSKTDTELVNSYIEANTKKIATSRAENAMLQESSYDKAKRIKDLKNRFKQELNINLKETNYSLKDIMQQSERISKGKMAITTEENQKKAANLILETLGHTNKNTKGLTLLESTLDNYDAIMSYMDDNENFISSILNVLDKELVGEKYKSKQSKQAVYDYVVKTLKQDLADNLYTKTTSSKIAANNETLKANLDYFKNLYEVDLSSLNIKDKVIELKHGSNPDYQDLFKINLSKASSYDVTKKVTKAV